uniref:Putative tail protein n=1 Tax=viral metagenome TaxID=1070528 RepID=A0A6M3KTR9_9ZZZZ
MASSSVTIKSYRKERESEILNSLQKGLEKAGLIVERQAKINVSQSSGHPRVQTGRLRSSITHEVEQGQVSIGTNVYYGKYLEFGTVNHPPYPWLYPAVESEKSKIIEALKGKFTIE